MLKKKINSFLINSLLSNQVHIGKNKKWNKNLNLYLFGIRHGIFFFNLKKTQIFLKRMIFFLYTSIINHKSCLFIGTNTLIHPLIDHLKNSLDQPSVNIAWVGGTLTNWITIKNYAKFLYSKNIQNTIQSKFELKPLDKISNKVLRYLKMKEKVKGLETASHFPNLIVCFEKNINEFALHEVFLLRLPLICFINSDEGFSNIMYPILGNTNSFESFNFYLNIVLNTIKKGFINRRINFLHFNKVLLKKNTILQKSLKFNKNNMSNRKTIKNLNKFFIFSNQYKKFFLKSNIRRFFYYFRIWNIKLNKKIKNKVLHKKQIKQYVKRIKNYNKQRAYDKKKN
tara:strand:- start:130 stop:1149 length:1020 start_codon:yes stop_codon:yes gene_type:complete